MWNVFNAASYIMKKIINASLVHVLKKFKIFNLRAVTA